MTNNADISDRLGVTLLKKGIVDFQTLDKAIKVKENGGQREGRTLAQILVKDFNVDHNSIFQEVTKLYGFREVFLEKEEINDNRISFMRKMLEPLPESLRGLMREENIVVYKYDEYRP